jgi:hypothetical protein
VVVVVVAVLEKVVVVVVTTESVLTEIVVTVTVEVGAVLVCCAIPKHDQALLYLAVPLQAEAYVGTLAGDDVMVMMGTTTLFFINGALVVVVVVMEVVVVVVVVRSVAAIADVEMTVVFVDMKNVAMTVVTGVTVIERKEIQSARRDARDSLTFVDVPVTARAQLSAEHTARVRNSGENGLDATNGVRPSRPRIIVLGNIKC